MNRAVSVVLKCLLGLSMLLGAFGVFILYITGRDMAWVAPEFAFLRWPMFALGVAFIVCLEVILAAIWVLLGRVSGARIFEFSSLRWVDVIIAAGAAAVVWVGATMFPVFYITHGPPILGIMQIVAVIVGLGFVLLMVTMRALLRQAATLNQELSEVI